MFFSDMRKKLRYEIDGSPTFTFTNQSSIVSNGIYAVDFTTDTTNQLQGNLPLDALMILNNSPCVVDVDGTLIAPKSEQTIYGVFRSFRIQNMGTITILPAEIKVYGSRHKTRLSRLFK